MPSRERRPVTVDSRERSFVGYIYLVMGTPGLHTQVAKALVTSTPDP